MEKILAAILAIGFIVVDFLFFHDLLKPGEYISVAQWLTGALSLPVIVLAVRLIASGHTVVQEPKTSK